MDLGTVENNIRSGSYATVKDAVEDIRLTFDNAMTFNDFLHPVHVLADRLRVRFELDYAIYALKHKCSAGKSSGLPSNLAPYSLGNDNSGRKGQKREREEYKPQVAPHPSQNGDPLKKQRVLQIRSESKVSSSEAFHQWSWENDKGGYTDYDEARSLQLEFAFQNGGQLVILKHEATGKSKAKQGVTYYEVNLSKNTQTNINTAFVRKIRRRAVGSSSSSAKATPVVPPVPLQSSSTMSLVKVKNVVTGSVENKEVMSHASALLALGERWKVVCNLSASKLEIFGTKKKVEDAVKEANQIISLGSFQDYPADWNWGNSQSPSVECRLVALDRKSGEWTEIEKRVHETLPNVKILSVQRVQNPLSWIGYAASMKRVQGKGTSPNEMLLFHGTRSTPPSLIHDNQHGFDLKYANEGLWGKGLYFASDAKYSHAYAYKEDSARAFFLCSVITGDSRECKQDTARTRPPAKPSNKAKHEQELHESIKCKHEGSRNYVLFDNHLAYPKYLISYK